jgi:hypothetical protein
MEPTYLRSPAVVYAETDQSVAGQHIGIDQIHGNPQWITHFDTINGASGGALQLRAKEIR